MVISGSLSTILFAALRNALVTNNGYYRIDNILEYFYNELQFEKLNVRIRSKIWISAQLVILRHLGDELAKPQLYYTLQLERSLLLIGEIRLNIGLRHDLLKYKAT